MNLYISKGLKVKMVSLDSCDLNHNLKKYAKHRHLSDKYKFLNTYLEGLNDRK